MLFPSEIQRVEDCVGIATPIRPLDAACAGAATIRPVTAIAVAARTVVSFLINCVPFLG